MLQHKKKQTDKDVCLKVLGRKLLILHYILRWDENDLRLKQFINYYAGLYAGCELG